MKNTSKIGLAVAGLLIGTSAAWGQSSVTLYGIVDATVRYSDNGSAKLKSLDSGGYQQNRFGVRGSEDLGGGLKAGFNLEAGFGVDTGASIAYTDKSRFWGRRSVVTLSDANLGEIRLGRDQTPIFNMYTSFDPFITNGAGNVQNMIRTLGTAVVAGNTGIGVQDQARTRSDNAFVYALPGNLGGVYGEVMISAGEGELGNRHRGGRLGYAAGPINVAAVAGETQVARTASITDSVKEYGFAGSYKFDVALVGVQYLERKLDTRKIKLAQLLGNVPITQQLRIRGSYTNVRDSSKSATGLSLDANQLALGLVYDLSKRTFLYGTYSHIDNKGAAAYRNGSLAAVAGQNYNTTEGGIRHAF